MNIIMEYWKRGCDEMTRQVDIEIKSLAFPKLFKKYGKRKNGKKDSTICVKAIPTINIKKYNDRP